MDLQKFEESIKIAKKHNVDSFSFDGVTVNLGHELPPFPMDDPIAEIEPEPQSSEDYLIRNPMI